MHSSLHRGLTVGRSTAAMPPSPLRRQPRRGGAGAAAAPDHRSSSRAASARAGAAPSGAPEVFVLDFDGVLVDSEPEVSMSAFTSARDYWPAVFAASDGAPAGEQQQQQEQQERVLAGLRRCRPVLVRGYESMVMARLLRERGPGCEEEILSRWEALLPETLAVSSRGRERALAKEGKGAGKG